MRCAAGLPFILEPGMEVAFVPPQLDAPRRTRVAEVDMATDTQATVHFEGIVDREVAEALVGCSVLVRHCDLPEEAFAYSPDVIGYEVCDARYGRMGVVRELVENPAHLLLFVDGAYGEVLVPYVDEFVRDIDDAVHIVRTSVPNGLIDV